MSDAVVTDSSCRLCLENDDNLMNVFDVPDLEKLIYQCVCVKIVQMDPLPTGVCFKCIGEVQNWTKFKRTCDQSQKSLLKHYKKSTMLPSITIHNLMNDSIDVDLSVFDHESLLDNLEASTNQSAVSFIPCQNLGVSTNQSAVSLIPCQNLGVSTNQSSVSLKPCQNLGASTNQSAVSLIPCQNLEVSPNQSTVSLLPCHSTPLPEYITQNSIASQLIPSNENEDFDLFKPIRREGEMMDSSCEVSQEEESLQEEEEQPEGRVDPPCDKVVFKRPLYVKSIERCYQGLNKNKERFPANTRNYECDLCRKHFSTFKSLSFHDQLEHKSILETRGVTCNECAQVFMNKSRLETHILMQHATRSVDFQCKLCFKCYVSEKSLRSHMRSHLEKNECKQCGKRFNSASLLSIHTDRIHRKVKRHACNTCNKEFYTRAEVNRHQRSVHLNMRAFRCPQCMLEFNTGSALVNHTRSVHSKETQFACDQCGERFKTASLRRYHFKKSHDEYVTLFSCPLCREMFTTKMGYRIHVRTHRPRENIICFLCNQSFASKRNLVQHIRRIHSKPNQTCGACGQKFLRQHKCPLLRPKSPIMRDWNPSRRSKYALASSLNEEPNKYALAPSLNEEPNKNRAPSPNEEPNKYALAPSLNEEPNKNALAPSLNEEPNKYALAPSLNEEPNKNALAPSPNEELNKKAVEKNSNPNDNRIETPQREEEKSEDTHRKKFAWQCDRCRNTYSKKSNLKRHMIRAHAFGLEIVRRYEN